MRLPDLPRLPDPHRSFVVLIGASRYRSTELADLPAVRNNLNALAHVFTHPTLGGLPAQRCVVLPDPSDVRTVYRVLRQYATAAEDTLLVYFAGHGRTGPRNELYLGLAHTEPHELPVSALPFDLVREVFKDSPADNRVMILDCCFAGRAIQDMSGLDETILGQLGIAGTYTLTSTPANAVALAPVGATYTAFTGELLQLLHTGVPGGPEFLTFNEIYRRLRHTMRQRGLPLPEQRTVGMADQLALTRNPAYNTPPPAQHATSDRTDPPTGSPSAAGNPPRPAASHPSPFHRRVNVPPPARPGRVRRWRIALTLLLVLGLLWAVSLALRGAPQERLAQPAHATYVRATFSITSVKVGNGRVVLTVTADNSGSDQELGIADCCTLVEQPIGKLRKRPPFDSGNFPGNFMAPIPARNRITGEVIFTDGGLDAATTTLVVTLALPVDRTVLQFNVQLTTG